MPTLVFAMLPIEEVLPGSIQSGIPQMPETAPVIGLIVALPLVFLNQSAVPSIASPKYPPTIGMFEATLYTPRVPAPSTSLSPSNPVSFKLSKNPGVSIMPASTPLSNNVFRSSTKVFFVSSAAVAAKSAAAICAGVSSFPRESTPYAACFAYPKPSFVLLSIWEFKLSNASLYSPPVSIAAEASNMASYAA